MILILSCCFQNGKVCEVRDMKTLRGCWSPRTKGPTETLRGMFLVLDSVQASKWASFCSLFWACFQKIHSFWSRRNAWVWMGKTPMLAGSAWALRIVAVLSYCEVLP